MSDLPVNKIIENDSPLSCVRLGVETWVELSMLSVSPTNFFGTDVKTDAKFEAMVERARTNPADLPTLLVRADRARNQLQIMSDPIGYLAVCEALGADAAVKVRTQQVGGTDADVSVYMYAAAEQQRPLRNMRRARALHHLQHVAHLTRAEIGRRCGISESAVCRDINAAELEMTMPHFAAILRLPSDAPATYYRSIRGYAENDENVECLESLHNHAAELVAKGERYAASKALIALGVTNIASKSKLIKTKPITIPVLGIEGWLEVDGTVDYRLVFSFQSEPEMLDNLARDVEAHIMRAGAKALPFVLLCAPERQTKLLMGPASNNVQTELF